MLIQKPPPTPTITHTPTLTATPSTTPTPAAPQINITKLSVAQPPGACFFVFDEFQNFRFEVCDNDFQGQPDDHPVCDDGTDTVCDDEDPEAGSIRVTVTPGQYRVQEGKPPVNHTLDPAKQACDASAGKCELTFVNEPNTRPWFPFDVDGDGAVTVVDIFAVAGAFGQTKP